MIKLINRLSGMAGLAAVMSVLVVGNARAGIISSIAGTGATGYTGDGVPAITSKVNNPCGIARDAAGNIFLADRLNHRVRRIDAVTGFISTVAGTGAPGFSGEGAAATAAMLCYPSDVAFDTVGNMYIADEMNDRIRKVDAVSGAITTVAGTSSWGYNGDGIPATAAQLNCPTGVAIDSSGNIYIADTGNARIRKVTVSTGLISTIVGDGTSSFNADDIPGPSAQISILFTHCGIELDTDGNLYIPDTGNNRVRKWNRLTTMVTTVAGTGTFGYNGDDIPATTADLSSPTGVALDACRNILIADSAGARLRSVDAISGSIFTIAGTGVAGYNGDGIEADLARLDGLQDVMVDPAGNAVLTDSGNSRARKFELASVRALAVSISVSSTYSTLGQEILVDVTVTNTGVTNVFNLAPSLVVSSGSAYVLHNRGPLPASKSLLGPGMVQTFYWKYCSIGNGLAVFDGAVDAVTCTTLALHGTASASIFTATSAANIAVSMAISSTVAAFGQSVTVSLSVTNVGSGVLTGLVPSIVTDDGGKYVSLAGGPTPPSVGSINPGEMRTFTWTYRAVGLGTAGFTGQIGGEACSTIGVSGVASVSLLTYLNQSMENSVKIVGGVRGYINPKRGESATILVKAVEPGDIRVRIYDMAGGLVWDKTVPGRGGAIEVIQWNGTDSSGKQVPPGLYPVLIEAPGVKYKDKLAVVR